MTSLKKPRSQRVSVWTLEEKIAVAKRLLGTGWNISAETRIAESALRDEFARHEAVKREIAERFDSEVWTQIKKHWTEDELRKGKS